MMYKKAKKKLFERLKRSLKEIPAEGIKRKQKNSFLFRKCLSISLVCKIADNDKLEKLNKVKDKTL